jgi:archaellum biogenesis ATPase FlaH
MALRPGCNFGVVGFASQWVIIDIDTSGGEAGQAEAWQSWADLCTAWGLAAPLDPHVQSARGGWHVYFAIPDHIDATTLRQPDAIKKRINVRCVGYTVAAGGYYDGTAKGEESGWYQLYPNAAAPYPAPDALILHCSRAEVAPEVIKAGTYDKSDVANLLDWFGVDSFEAYEDWLNIGMALKLEFGDAGKDLWAHTHNDTVMPDVIETKWKSFADTPTAQSVTLRSFFDRAHKRGWKGTVRPSVESMFSGVAQLAMAASAPVTSLPTVQSPPLAPVESTVLRSRRITAASLEGKPVPVREWLVRDVIPAKNVTLLYGDGGTGKSLWALQLGAAVVTGKLFFGHLVQQGGVEFISAEDSLDELHRRLVDIARQSTTSMDELAALHLTSLAEADALLAVAEENRSAKLNMTPLYDELETVIKESKPALVVLDTLADIFGGNEIIRSQARQFIGSLRKLCLQYDTTIVVLAHPSLSGMDRGTSGSTAWNNSVRSRLLFRRAIEKDAETDEDARVLEVCKSNYGRIGLQIPMRWRSGAFVATGCGDPILAASKADRVFLELLEKSRSQNINVHVQPGRAMRPTPLKGTPARKV